MRLTPDIKDSLNGYMKNLEDDIKIVLQKGNHTKRKDMVTFLADVCDVSNKLYFEESDLKDNTKSPITCSLFKNEIAFSIPSFLLIVIIKLSFRAETTWENEPTSFLMALKFFLISGQKFCILCYRHL